MEIEEVPLQPGGAPPAPGAAAAPMPSAHAAAQIRVRTLPLKAAAWAAGEQTRPSALQSQVGFPKEERWDRALALRSEQSFATEFDKLAPAMSVMGKGLAKVLDGFGLKAVDPEVKEREEKEKKEREEKEKLEKEEKDRKEREIATANGLLDEYITKKSKEEAEKNRVAERQRKLAVLLAIPDCIVNGSRIIEGIREVCSGGRETATVLGQMVGHIPSLMRRRSSGCHLPTMGLSAVPSMGTGYKGLRLLLNRHILTRASEGSVLVCDGFGPKQGRVPRNFFGTRVINTKSELRQALEDFKHGRLTQRLDINVKCVSLKAASEMWEMLLSEQLTGLLVSDCSLLDMALQAKALMEEKAVVQGQLEAAQDIVKELNFSISSLNLQLAKIPMKGNLE